MNPGAIETGGEVAKGFIESMKSEPIALALVVMNLALLVFLWYSTSRSSDLRSHDLTLYFAQQKETAQMLSRCIVPRQQ
jgi:hypothetical protein